METVLALAQHGPEHIYFSGRNVQRAESLIAKVQKEAPNVGMTFVECDLGSLASVKAALAQKFTSARLDVLICNAGIMALPPKLTTDGYEVQFGTNHLGHALMIKLLLPTLLKTAELPGVDARIIILTSIGFRGHPKGGIIFKDLKTTQDFSTLGPWVRYGQSKLANILYAAELARLHPNITSVSIHPGVVETDLVGNLGFGQKMFIYAWNLGRLLKPAEGAYNQLWAATGPKDKIVNGAFYEPVGTLSSKLDKTAKSEQLARELWEWTEKALAEF